jgi:hypothetical protein
MVITLRLMGIVYPLQRDSESDSFRGERASERATDIERALNAKEWGPGGGANNREMDSSRVESQSTSQ